MRFVGPRQTNSRRRVLGGACAWVGARLGARLGVKVGTSGLAAAAWPRAAIAEPTVRPWPAGKPPPPLRLLDLDGKTWRLDALVGRSVVLNFWATWCDPCRAEMPSLAALARRHERAGLVVLTVNYREPPATIRRFLEATPTAMPVLLDTEGEATNAWTPRVFPSTVLIDRGGVPRHTVVGELDWAGDLARELVEPLLALPRTT